MSYAARVRVPCVESMPNGDPAQPLPFQPLGGYTIPPMPTDDVARGLWKRLKEAVTRDSGEPFIAEDQLRKVSQSQLNGVQASPVCEPLLGELDVTLAEWAGAATHKSPLRVVVMPPCERNGLLRMWAERHGYAILEPPSRDTLRRGHPVVRPDLTGEGLMVIPELERWFLRHRTGLIAVRSLLESVGAMERTCVIGCNSWAWAFLGKAVEANMILPRPLVFQPYTAARLEAWLSGAVDAANRGVVYRLSQSGETLSPGGEASVTGPFFKKLAAQSLGIPWVAWWVWHQSLRSRPEEPGDEQAPAHPDGGNDDGGDHEDDRAQWKRTVWLAASDTFILPDQHEPDELIVLQALLIHGPLAPDELHVVVPAMREVSVVQSLISSGLIERAEGLLRVLPVAYPSIRRGLAAAGFPVDTL